MQANHKRKDRRNRQTRHDRKHLHFRHLTMDQKMKEYQKICDHLG